MFPYWEPVVWDAWGILIYPPVYLIGLAVLVGHFLLMRRAKVMGLNAALAGEFSAITVIAGFFLAHAAKFLYLEDGPAALLRSPILLVQFWRGMASLGGIVGGLGIGALWLRSRRQGAQRVAPYLDALAFVFPFAWILGRMHCAWVHDHPGVRTDSWLGVQYPGGARFDLGLLEVLFLAMIIGAFLWLDRQPRVTGFFLGIFLLSYGTFRLLLDELHAQVIRRGGLSSDQWGSAVLLLTGSTVLWSTRKRRYADAE